MAEPVRLLDFGTHTKSMPVSQVEAMIANKTWEQVGPGFIDITDLQPVGNRTKRFSDFAIPDQPKHQELVEGFLDNLKPDAIVATITHLSNYFTRYYTTTTAVEAVTWLQGQYEAAARGRTDVAIQIFEHTFAQPSLIVTIEGGGQNKGETVILGGHIDSTAGGANNRSPGADDDASGSAAVLEVFKILMASGFVPDRTVEFHAYAAEEAGLRGSAAIAQLYANTGRNVITMVQFDMIGYPNDVTTPIGLTSDYVDPALTAFVGTLTTTYSALKTSPSTCGYACSDHGSWYREGYASSFPFEVSFGRHNPAIHTVNDVISRISIDRCNEFVKMGVGYVVELADPVP